MQNKMLEAYKNALKFAKEKQADCKRVTTKEVRDELKLCWDSIIVALSKEILIEQEKDEQARKERMDFRQGVIA